MDNKGKSNHRSDKINILVQVDAHIGTHVEHTSQFRLCIHAEHCCEEP
jgi:hypothetical protein